MSGAVALPSLIIKMNAEAKSLSELVEEFLEDAPPPSPSPAEAWVERFNAYNCRYKGPELWVSFCKMVAATGSLEMACQRYHISRAILIRKRERYPEFDAHLTMAQEHFKYAVLERAAFVRAIDGVDVPVFHKGVIAGYKREYSDSLMKDLLPGNIPEKYRKDNDVDVGVTFVLKMNPIDNQL